MCCTALNITLFMHLMETLFTVAVVGLERTFYQVLEDAEELQLCVNIHSPDIECPIAFAFNMTISTSDNTAGSDFCFMLCIT